MYQDLIKPGLYAIIGSTDVSTDRQLLIEPHYKPIFNSNDSTSFNVLILNFEDYIAQKETSCIGRAIQENLNNISANDSLPINLNTQYIDSIMPPRSRNDAKKILSRHNADLVIYGLARNVKADCEGAELSFRYNISPHVTSKAVPVIEVKSFKHDSNYTSTNTIDIEKGLFKTDSLSLKKWTKALINLKADKSNDAFLELDEILTNARDLLQLGTKTVNGEKYITIKELSRRKDRYSGIAQTYFELGLNEKALKVFNEAILLYPEESGFYQNRGATYGELKQYEKSLKDFNKAISLNPNDAVYYSNRGAAYNNLNENLKALKDYDMAISLAPSLSGTYFSKGNLYYQLMDYEKAIKELSTFISLSPQESKGYINRGAAYAYLKQYDLSIKDFLMAIKIEPNDILTLNNLSGVYTLNKQFEKAIVTIKKASYLYPNHSKNYGQMGIIFSEMKEYKQSISAFDKAIELDSTDAFTYNNRAFSFLKLNRITDAFKDLEKSKLLDENNSWMYRNMACYYVLKMKNDQAIRYLEKSISMGYDDIYWMRTEELLNPIRETTEFKNLIEKLMIIN
ncbi:tetratricopeptide repeat protein [Arenibacter sp. F26102]|uniref:tetratricopeptide repeat protein n=1 Tax=Arenibacter sp. F26102 TaxID=2926416 RepID=UPI001FF5BCA0|nr:tetratricopeptide repeat protein [Arenibacter sp. F26102]MCK0145307.1 tetratricopeptide repeat protein [Arenibacter sp. F26102]